MMPLTPEHRKYTGGYINSKDIGMEFDIETCALLIVRSGKRQIMEGIELPDKERIRTHKEEKN